MVFTGCWIGIGLVTGGMCIAGLIVFFVQRIFPEHVLRTAHDATGNLLSIVGTLYAVLLGLIVVDAMVRFERAMDIVQQESNCLADIFLLAERLPDPYRKNVRDHCHDYAHTVIHEEWALMQEARMSVKARRSALQLVRSLATFEPTTETQKAVFPLLLEQVRDLWDRRRERATMAQYGIPVIEWVTLLIGAVVTVLFAGLFSVGNGRLQSLLTSLVALVIGLNLYLVSLFGYPFSGELSVSVRPFEVDIGIFEGQFDAGPAHAGEAHNVKAVD
ncbi:MAG: hypothetical protein ACK6CT_13850 [Planctomycetia bacterium]|jgi:hypothetical protein